MSEEKTLDEKTLEGVAGGDRVDLRQGGQMRELRAGRCGLSLFL